MGRWESGEYNYKVDAHLKSHDQPSGLNKMQNSNGSNSHVTHLIYLVYGWNLIRFHSEIDLTVSEQT